MAGSSSVGIGLLMSVFHRVLQWEQTGLELQESITAAGFALTDMEWASGGSRQASVKRLVRPAPTLLIMGLAWTANLCKIAHIAYH